MEAVGFFGIIKLTKQIILKNLKHFLCVAFLLIISYAFKLFVFDLASLALGTLVAFTQALYTLIVSKEQIPSLDFSLNSNSTTIPQAQNNTSDPSTIPTAQLPPLAPFVLHFVFSIIIPFLSNPLLTFTICRACLNKSLDLKASLRSIPRSAKNFARTSLCIGAVFVGFFSMTLGMMGITVGVLTVLNENLVTPIVITCISCGLAICRLYLAITFSLAPTVCMLEEKEKGWGAMRRSMELLDGRKWQALGLTCLSVGISMVKWRWRGQAGIVVLQICLQASISLFSMAAHVVLYMCCKSRRQEPLHTLIAASSEFGPLQPLANKPIDLEIAPFL